MLQKENDPSQLVVVEVLENIEAHQASIQDIPREALEKAMLLIDPPKGADNNPF